MGFITRVIIPFRANLAGFFLNIVAAISYDPQAHVFVMSIHAHSLSQELLIAMPQLPGSV